MPLYKPTSKKPRGPRSRYLKRLKAYVHGGTHELADLPEVVPPVEGYKAPPGSATTPVSLSNAAGASTGADAAGSAAGLVPGLAPAVEAEVSLFNELSKPMVRAAGYDYDPNQPKVTALHTINPIGGMVYGHQLKRFYDKKAAGERVQTDIDKIYEGQRKKDEAFAEAMARQKAEQARRDAAYYNAGTSGMEFVVKDGGYYRGGVVKYQDGGEKLTELDPLNEAEFKKWYKKYAELTGNAVNPDDPLHYYDYRGYWRDSGGAMPSKRDDYHLPSNYKLKGHPDKYVEGKDTKNSTKEFLDGGDIDGKGGPKSDSIKASFPSGSFIVPAEYAKQAEAIRKQYLKERTKEAKLKHGGEPIRVSDGEHVFMPDEVNELVSRGIDLNALAPNSKYPLRYDDGGGVPYRTDWYPGIETSGLQPLDLANLQMEPLPGYTGYTVPAPIITAPTNPYLTVPGTTSLAPAYNAQQAIPAAYTQPATVAAPATTTPASKQGGSQTSNLGYYVGAGQAAIGAYGLLKQEDRPVDRMPGKWDKYDLPGALPLHGIDPRIEANVQRAGQESRYGFEMAEKGAIQDAIERARADRIRQAEDVSGGSAAVALSTAGAAFSQSNASYLNMVTQDAALKRQKQAMYSSLLGDLDTRKERIDAQKIANRQYMDAQKRQQYADQLAEQLYMDKYRRQLYEDKIGAYDKEQAAYAALMNQGLQNMVNSSQSQIDLQTVLALAG